jgi:hypothetical protein
LGRRECRGSLRRGRSGTARPPGFIPMCVNPVVVSSPGLGNSMRTELREQKVDLAFVGDGEVEDEVRSGPDGVVGQMTGDVIGDRHEQGRGPTDAQCPQPLGLELAGRRQEYGRTGAVRPGEHGIIHEVDAAQALQK